MSIIESVMTQEEFTAHYEESKHLVRRMVSRYAGGRLLCEVDDICQEVWLKAWRSREAVRCALDEGGFGGWIAVIAKNTVWEWGRRTARRADTQGPKMVTVTQPVGTAGLELAAALGKVPERELPLVRLFYVYGYTTHEISHSTGINASTVKTRIWRGTKPARQ